MISDVCNLRDKISASLLPIYTCLVGQVQCKSLLPEPKSDCPAAIGQPNCRILDLGCSLWSCIYIAVIMYLHWDTALSFRRAVIT